MIGLTGQILGFGLRTDAGWCPAVDLLGVTGRSVKRRPSVKAGQPQPPKSSGDSERRASARAAERG
jgi:hypothetical protein